MPLKLYWPTQFNKILQRFREHPEWYKGFGLPGHEGIDFSIAKGSEIYACADGVVAEVRLDAEQYAQTHQGTYAYGNQVRIRHALPEGEYFTVYAHLLEPRVQAGDPIKAGQLVGLGDSTGNSTGDHLHLTLKKTGSTAAGETDYPRDLIDPEPFLQPFGVKPESTGEAGTPETPTIPTTPQGTDGLKYVADVTIPDGTTLKAGEAFTKTWRVTNTGTNAWGSGYILRFAEGNQLSGPNSFPLAPAQPGQTIEISIPLHAPGAPGRYVSKWTAANALGYSFGATITTVIVVAAQPAQIPPPVTPTPPVPADALKFLGDSNFPPGGMVLGGQRLVKTWKIQNSGSAAWGSGYSIVYVSGEPLKQATLNPLPALQPGQEGEVSVMVITPINPGSYQCVWQARNPQGQLFGDLLVFEFSLQVGEPIEQ